MIGNTDDTHIAPTVFLHLDGFELEEKDKSELPSWIENVKPIECVERLSTVSEIAAAAPPSSELSHQIDLFPSSDFIRLRGFCSSPISILKQSRFDQITLDLFSSIKKICKQNQVDLTHSSVFVHVYLVDISLFDSLNEIYKSFFTDLPPSR